MLPIAERKTETLVSWYDKRMSRPILYSFCMAILLQACVLAYQVIQNREEADKSIDNFGDIISLALHQKNRILIETISNYALNHSEFESVCIFEDGELRFQVPYSKDESCKIKSTWLLDRKDIALKSLPHYSLVFSLHRIPNAGTPLKQFAISLVFLFPMLYLLLGTRRSISTDLIKPLQTSIADMKVEKLEISTGSYSSIAEIDDLFKAYVGKLVEVKESSIRQMNLEKDAAVGRITSHLTHDLRAPLSIFERTLATPDHQLPLMKGEIRDSLNRLYAMIDALRYSESENLIRVSRGMLSLDFGFQNLRNKAEMRGVRLQVPPKDFGDVSIDAAKVERAWVNLTSNAIDFAKSEVRIEVEMLESDLILRVIDDGPGVPDEFLPKLFQRGATQGKHDGTGLGLAYVRQIMRGHGGDVTYRRENGLTIFECRLPNAVEPEKGQVVENAMSLEIQLLQKQVRVVAICLDPESLSRSVRTKLASYKSDEFFFVEERPEANIVVSNVEDIMIEVLEADDKEFVSVGQYKGDEDRIVDILKRKFNLA